MPPAFRPDPTYTCNLCEDEGITIRLDGTRRVAVFCSCAKGQRRQRLYDAHQAEIKAKAQGREDRLVRKHTKTCTPDYKAAAAGNGERWPGEDNEPPF